MPRTNTTSVLVIDHNPILLEGIACLINAEPDMALKASATTLQCGVELAASTRYDCIVVDLDVSIPSGVDVIASIRKADLTAIIIGLITYELDDRVSDALAAGLSAVVSKDQIPETLVDLIRKHVPNPNSA